MIFREKITLLLKFMKHFRSIIFIIVSSIFIISCSTDFKVGADYKEYTVVFGLLSRTDSAHYIKITKGFYDEKQNNLLVAKNPDSLYHKDLTVKMYKLQNGGITDSLTLEKVDLTTEGYPKDTGVFANTPNYAYKFKEILDPTKRYKLVVKNNISGKVVYGETDVIDNRKIKIVQPTNADGPILDFATIGKSKTTFYWNSPSSVSIYDLYMRLPYEEKNVNTGIITDKMAMIPLARNVANTSSNMTYFIFAEDFYSALQGTVGIAPNNITRFIDTPDIILSAGGLELKTYIDVTSSQGGITYDQIKPYYTNLIGGTVLGLLSTRASSNANQVMFTKQTLDSILYGSHTRSLNFVDVSSK